MISTTQSVKYKLRDLRCMGINIHGSAVTSMKSWCSIKNLCDICLPPHTHTNTHTHTHTHTHAQKRTKQVQWVSSVKHTDLIQPASLKWMHKTQEIKQCHLTAYSSTSGDYFFYHSLSTGYVEMTQRQNVIIAFITVWRNNCYHNTKTC